jgi:hypothetical protein
MKTPATENVDVRATLLKLLAYCRAEDWAGHDPYDALTSELLKKAPFLDSRIPRIALTQILKRSPINVRRLALVPKAQNAKAMALFLSSFLRMTTADVPERDELIEHMIKRLSELRSKGFQYDCWGYSFPWQTRTILVPQGYPNVVCTTFVTSSLLDAYEESRDERCLKMALSAAEYMLNELYWTEGDAAGFSYPMPKIKSHTYNANLLAAAVFCRIARIANSAKFLEPALRSARYATSKQNADGSWFYGEAEHSRWIDNFHTGYNLDALQTIGRELQTDEFELSVRRGFEFYRANFFREDGAPKYFHNNPYPLDVHCVAQSILTLLQFKHLDSSNVELAHSVFAWAMKNMWDDRGFFYYRVLRFCTVKTSYMRWSQAWMLLALSTLLRDTEEQTAEQSDQMAGAVRR